LHVITTKIPPRFWINSSWKDQNCWHQHYFGALSKMCYRQNWGKNAW
jgi:hypothetical protein